MSDNKKMSEAALYDIFNINCVEDIEMYKKICFGTIKVLELGIGTGRIAIPLSKKGVNVCGIDNSVSMLKSLENKINADKISGITFYKQDMRSLSLETSFEIILCPFCTFNFLLSLDDQEKTLLSVSKHMRKKSKIVFDLLTINTFQNTLQDNNSLKYFSSYKCLDEDEIIEIYTSNTFSQHTQILSQERFFRKYDYSHTLVEEFHLNMKNRLFFLGEFQLLLDKCGYKILNTYGNYKLGPFSQSSPNLIVVATLK